MPFDALAWVFTVGVICHNVEEAIFFPAWSLHPGLWYRPVGRIEFAFAASVLTLTLVLIADVALSFGPNSTFAYLFTGYVFAMVVNAVVPHCVVTIAERRYMPGTLTAVLLNLPLGCMFLYRALSEHFVDTQIARWAMPATAIGILVFIPLLFAVGRQLPRIGHIINDRTSGRR